MKTDLQTARWVFNGTKYHYIIVWAHTILIRPETCFNSQTSVKSLKRLSCLRLTDRYLLEYLTDLFRLYKTMGRKCCVIFVFFRSVLRTWDQQYKCFQEMSLFHRCGLVSFKKKCSNFNNYGTVCWFNINLMILQNNFTSFYAMFLESNCSNPLWFPLYFWCFHVLNATVFLPVLRGQHRLTKFIFPYD